MRGHCNGKSNKDCNDDDDDDDIDNNSDNEGLDSAFPQRLDNDEGATATAAR